MYDLLCYSKKIARDLLLKKKKKCKRVRLREARKKEIRP